MKVTYLGHSGFLAETERAYYLFDYIRGILPEFQSGKPLYVFASHFHEDHFLPIIFEEPVCSQVTKYLLSSDIQKHHKHRRPVWISAYTDQIQWMRPKEKCSLKEVGAEVETLVSTDVGVAFIIREDGGKKLYHAGDLNWWHWEGEEKSWNRNMEVNYKREIDKLQGQSFDTAFVPLDPRLEAAYGYGLTYFLGQVHTKHMFPMHFWEQYDVIPRYQKEYQDQIPKNTNIHIIQKENEDYEI